MTLIEKLEALRDSIDGDYYMGQVWERKTIKDILEQAKAEQQEAVGVVEYTYDPDGQPTGQFGNLTQSFFMKEGAELYLQKPAPQPTPDDVKDAERWRKVSWAIEQAIQNGSCYFDIEQAYEEAMKGGNSDN